VVRGHGADNTGLVREVQAAELAVLLHGVVPFLFENSATLMMHLMRQSETVSRMLDLGSSSYPRIHRKAQDEVGCELMQIHVEIPEDIDKRGMKGKPKAGKQQIPKDNNLILPRLRHGLSPGSPHYPDHPVLLQG
jgi:hypothetical protein